MAAMEPTAPYATLTPDTVLDALGMRPDPIITLAQTVGYPAPAPETPAPK